MKKALKITGIVIGVLILLLIALGLALPFLLNPNHFKPEIAQAVKDRTGRALNIEGDIKFSIFPWLGAQIGPMELANAPGFNGAPFAAINETDVHVHFWPLLHGEIQVGEVKLDGLSLDLERDANGRSNWQDISQRLTGDTTPSAAGKSGGAESADKLSIAGLAITNSQVRWLDAEKHQQYTVGGFSLTLGAFTSGQPTAMDSGFDVAGTNPEIHGHADFHGTLTADLAHRIYSADDAKLGLQFTGGSIPGGQVQATLGWKHAVANMDNGTAALNGLDLSADGLSLHLEAQGRDMSEHPQFTGAAKLDAFSPRDVLRALGYAYLVNTRDGSAFGRAGASFSFEATPASVSLAALDMQLDDSHLTGKAAVKDFKSQALDFDLNLDRFDADRYLPMQQQQQTPAPAQAGLPLKPREEVDVNKVGLPLRTLRALNLNGHVHVGQWVLLNTHANDLDVTVSAHQGVVHIKPLEAALYGGSLQGDLQVDAATDSPVVAETLNLKGVKLDGLAQDLFKSNRLSGTVDLATSSRALGRTLGELRHTLSGKLSFDLKKGALEGINVTDAILRAYAAAKGRPAPPAAPNRTDFADIHGSGNISRGVLTNRDFAATLPFLSLGGEGKLDLAELTVDYSLKARFTGTSQLDAQQAGELKGAALPIHVSGTLSDLSVRPDVSGLVKGKVDDALDRKKADLRKKLKDKLQDLTNGGG